MERLGIVLAMSFVLDPDHARLRGEAAEDLDGRQHSTGEDVPLDEVLPDKQVLIEALIDGDRLHGSLATRWDRSRDRVEQRRPDGLVDGFDHLDRHDLVVHGRLIPEVLELHLGSIRQTRFGETLAGKDGHLLGQCETRHTDVEVARGILHEASPPTTDLEDAIAWLEVEHATEAVVLRRLRLGKRDAVVLEQGRRVGHALVEPQRVEVVPQVVVVAHFTDGV